LYDNPKLLKTACCLFVRTALQQLIWVTLNAAAVNELKTLRFKLVACYMYFSFLVLTIVIVLEGV